MPGLLNMLPDATIVVHHSEHGDYADAAPSANIVTHDITRGLARIRNWILDTFEEPCIVMVDDDLKGIRPTLTKPRLRKDPDLIEQVIENTHRIAEDLDIGMFGWARTINPADLRADQLPFRLVAPMSCAWGVRGDARERRMDERYVNRQDYDLLLRALRDDRIVLQEARWHFDHGKIFAGRGGNAGIVTKDDFDNDTERLQAEWGRYAKSKSGKSKPRVPMSPQVNRTQNI